MYYSADLALKQYVPGFVMNILTGQALKSAVCWVKKYSEEDFARHGQAAGAGGRGVLGVLGGAGGGGGSRLMGLLGRPPPPPPALPPPRPVPFYRRPVPLYVAAAWPFLVATPALVYFDRRDAE